MKELNSKETSKHKDDLYINDLTYMNQTEDELPWTTVEEVKDARKEK